jgi:hypothetical protein
MAQAMTLIDIVNSIDRFDPPRSCQEIGSELNLAVSQLREDGQETDAQQLDFERLACLMTVRATILSSASIHDNETSKERIIGMVGYSDGTQWPDPNALSLEAFQHLHRRAEATPNPVLKARYHDLVFEKGHLPNPHLSALAAINAYLESAHIFANTELARYQIEMTVDMDQAAFLALKMGNREKISSVILSLMTLIDDQVVPSANNSENYPMGRWVLELSRILMFVRQSKKFGSLVTDAHLNRVKDLSQDLAAGMVQSGYGYAEEQFLQIASQAAHLLKKSSDEYDLELRRGEAIIRQGEISEQQEGNGPRHLIAATFYENAVQHYQQIREQLTLTVEKREDLQRRENELKLRIREMYRVGRSEFGRIEVPIEIPKDELEQMLEYFLVPDTLEACLSRIVTDGSLLPNLKSAEKSVLSLFPLRKTQNDMTVSVAETETQKISQQMRDSLLLWIQINSGIVLSELFSRLKAQKGLDAVSLINYLTATGLFDENNVVLIERGVERYFADDYISTLHILVPQFEDVLRTLLERSGQGIIRQRRGQAGWEMETFGKFLEQDVVKTILPAEMLTYIQLVMTEQTGWNLRNRIAHGLIRPQDCTSVTAITVLHLILLLTLFQITENNDENKKEGLV